MTFELELLFPFFVSHDKNIQTKILTSGYKIFHIKKKEVFPFCLLSRESNIKKYISLLTSFLFQNRIDIDRKIFWKNFWVAVIFETCVKAKKNYCFLNFDGKFSRLYKILPLKNCIFLCQGLTEASLLLSMENFFFCSQEIFTYNNTFLTSACNTHVEIERVFNKLKPQVKT